MEVNDNKDIQVKDGCIIFNKTKNERPLILNKGADPKVGDEIGIHPLDTSDDNFITHGLNYFKEGDQVILRTLRTEDEAAFKPGFEGMYGCHPVGVNWNVTEGYNDDGSVKYYGYTMHLDEPFYRIDGDMNLYIVFGSRFCQQGMQAWYPYGGAAIGFSNDDVTYYWHLGTSPYDVLGAAAILYYAGPKGLKPEGSSSTCMGDYWCYPNALNYTTCAVKYGAAALTDLPMDLAVNYVHIHIRHNSSLYWYNCTKTRMGEFKVCRGNPFEVDPCPLMAGDQRCK